MRSSRRLARAAPMQALPDDRVRRYFRAEAPNRLWVADFTCVATWRGFAYTAFVIDTFADRIVGRRTSHSMRTGLVLFALEQALAARSTDESLTHHSDRGTQYVSIRHTERLRQVGIEPSVGSTGDSYDNALAASIIGLYKTEVIHWRGPWRTLSDFEYATLEWVDWFNNRRLLSSIGYVPPAEFEQAYYRKKRRSGPGGLTQTRRSPIKSGRFNGSVCEGTVTAGTIHDPRRHGAAPGHLSG